ncbi:pyruvate kinase [Microbacterium thalassium]|uniref:Pyruvate kinase n=1 Tax=Microbacterium thalassium TaxID=362649 RepID=A0A7X0KVD8_9MICO|nr:pyruvate kinase [Microbacterium thalassium]MBB6392132.1 pyruvate kinase [Microbacterium thalassium]GLK24909.1 pyruvate kinase [Microbacterium thalassium]
MRRAKIVATLGPATASYETVEELVRAGLDVARINRSHGDYADHEKAYAYVRRASDTTGKAVGILVDLQGPKIRLARFVDGPHELAPGDEFTITTEDVPGTKEICGTTYPELAKDVEAGDTLLIDDGKVRLRVLDSDGVKVRTEVVVGGKVSNNKGINLPGVAVSAPALSEKDEADLRWALRLGADIVALSFVRSPKDVIRARVIMAEEGRDVPLFAKIEKPEAVDHLQDIIDAFDGVMVARGDLGVELPLETVPLVQKRAIELARRWAKPVIVATQMLESMIDNPVPTRAETSDVANAVLDGADAVMLSGETSVGAHPVTVVETMARIVSSTEREGLSRIPALGTKPRTQGGAITLAAASIADFVGARYVCVFSQSGDSARRMSRLRHEVPILGFTDLPGTRSRSAIIWGVETFLVRRGKTTDELLAILDETLLSSGRAQIGDRVIMTAGAPPGIAGSTNDVRVHTIGAGSAEVIR